jgi:hypothetical protein
MTNGGGGDLVEYYFVDERRLAQYFEQISDPEKQGLLQNWSVSVGWSGISFDTKRNFQTRPFTTQEKIDVFYAYLTKHRKLLEERFNFYKRLERDTSQDLDDSLTFFHEEVRAHRCEVPCKLPDGSKQSLHIWVSLDNKLGPLFLIEDYKSEPGWVHAMSGWSGLLLLSEEMNRSLNNDVFAPRRDFLALGKDAEKTFAKDPIAALEALGAQCGPSRTARVLYRLRAYCVEMNEERPSRTVVVGYPIIISTAAGSRKYGRTRRGTRVIWVGGVLVGAIFLLWFLSSFDSIARILKMIPSLF